ncbi:MAG: glycosyl transferase, family 25 [Acidobacteriota bacterium]|nr:glycosyl transferase, family 25 [Acidobacteriota bacterium]
MKPSTETHPGSPVIKPLRSARKRNIISDVLQCFRQHERLSAFFAEESPVKPHRIVDMTKDITNRLAGEINEAFPYKVCINLDRRPERWQQMLRKFEQQGISSVRRFSALDGENLRLPAHWIHTPGAYGCLRSHAQVVSEARRLGVSSLLIFEDDVVFDPQLQKKFRSYIEQLPPRWDMLFFGALHKDEPVKVSENIVRLTKSNSTYAYALRDTVFDAFIELNQRAEDVLDNNSFLLQQQFNCYCFMPHLAWVETGYSDAQLRLERHWYLQESLVLFGAGADRLLNDTTIIFAHKDDTGDGGATENLMYLVAYYHNFFSPYIAIVIVEQGAQSRINPASLPANCKHVFLRDESRFNKDLCFTTGISNCDPGRKFVILSDNDIYLETLDFRANLLMCEKHDCAAGFSQIVDLTGEDSFRLLSTNTTRGIDITKYAQSINNGRKGYCCFFKREVIQRLEGCGEGSSEKVESLLSFATQEQLRVFQSPNHALRLNQD